MMRLKRLTHTGFSGGSAFFVWRINLGRVMNAMGTVPLRCRHLLSCGDGVEPPFPFFSGWRINFGSVMNVTGIVPLRCRRLLSCGVSPLLLFRWSQAPSATIHSVVLSKVRFHLTIMTIRMMNTNSLTLLCKNQMIIYFSSISINNIATPSTYIHNVMFIFPCTIAITL